MSLTFHWFLPTNGDGRDIVGGGHGAGTSLVGSHEEVANLIGEYARAGATEFIISGYPHLEEAYWFGEGVLPILEQRGLWRHPAPPAGPVQTHSPFARLHPDPSTREKATVR